MTYHIVLGILCHAKYIKSHKAEFQNIKKKPSAGEGSLCFIVSFLACRNQYIPPIPPPIPPAGAGSGSGRSATTLSVVSSVAATEAAF